jgi:DNA (cytosine-5)-methyltransferase 1
MNYSVMFSSAGVGETYLANIGFKCAAANELITKRAQFHNHLYPDANMVIGDIKNNEIFNEFVKSSIDSKIDLLLATPPCQGFSLSGKNKNLEQMKNDDRNFLVFKVFDAIDKIKPNYVLIENVPRFLNMYFPYKGDLYNIVDLLKLLYGSEYTVESKVLNSMNYGVPQSRKRSFIKIYKKSKAWDWPTETPEKLTVRDAIGHLPSLESEEKSDIKWHFGRKHSSQHILWRNILLSISCG